MKLNFSKFFSRNKGTTATIPAAKFSGQRYGIGASEFYDEDEENDVRMIRPTKTRSEFEDDLDAEDSSADFNDDADYDDDGFSDQDDTARNYENEFDQDDEFDDEDDDSEFCEEDKCMAPETARILADLIRNISCNEETCEKLKDWVDSCHYLGDEDRDYLLDMIDDRGADDSEGLDDSDDEFENSHMEFDEFNQDEDFDDENDLDDKLNALRNRYKDEDSDWSVKKKF